MANELDLIGNIDYLLLGMFEEQQAAAKDYAKKQEAFAEKIIADFRVIYDNYLPNIHILDADNVATLVVDGIIEDFTTILTYSGDEEHKLLIREALIKAAPSLRKDIREGIAKLHSKFKRRVGSLNPIEELNSSMSDIVNSITTSHGYTQQAAQLIGNRFSKEINRVFPKNTALLGIDGDSIGIESREHRYVFFQKSFLKGKDTINTNITSILKESLQNLKSILAYSDVKDVGSITGLYADFGHVATREGTSDHININTPALTKIIYNVVNLDAKVLHVSRRDPASAKNIFLKRTGHISQAITVTKEFSEKTGILFTLGVTQTTDMASEFNRNILAKKESRQLDRAVQDRLNSTELMRDALVDRLSKSFLGNAIGKIYKGISSDSIHDYLEKLIMNSIKGTSTPSFTQNKTRVKNNTVEIKELGKLTLLNKVKVSVPKVSSAPKSYKTINKTDGLNLTNLVSLINSLLTSKIISNMGTGSSRNILNYRTGRFAASAKVERMTLSREGMITAFYSYMKNPYATFSEGGRQEFPRSRDPKLLISQSIRDIAQQQVSNRLRAVVV